MHPNRGKVHLDFVLFDIVEKKLTRFSELRGKVAILMIQGN
jgi:hypothetical protein